jgi:TIR domain
MDLFISYNSHDEVWAKRLFFDLRARFPTIKLFWARNVTAIPQGEPFRPVFEGAAQNATHFVVLWSAAAQRSNEVGPEIQSYLQNRQTTPTSPTGAKRRLFYVPVEQGIDYGGLVDLQSFPEFRGVYDPAKDDRGIAGLDSDAARENWRRMIGSIGDTVLSDQATQPITLALLVMTKTTIGQIKHVVDERIFGGPTLNEFLQSVGLTVDRAMARFDNAAVSWCPFGTNKTIIDLMEEVREMANQNLGEGHRFHWVPIDFVESMRTAPDRAAGRRLLDGLSDAPSVVVTDPISLFHPVVNKVFKYLSEYAKKPQSMILSISPNELQTAECLYSGLLSNSSPMLDAYLNPQIPGTETFALCGMNVQAAWDIERLIRSGLGYYHLQKRKAVSQPLVSSGV